MSGEPSLSTRLRSSIETWRHKNKSKSKINRIMLKSWAVLSMRKKWTSRWKGLSNRMMHKWWINQSKCDKNVTCRCASNKHNSDKLMPRSQDSLLSTIKARYKQKRIWMCKKATKYYNEIRTWRSSMQVWGEIQSINRKVLWLAQMETCVTKRLYKNNTTNKSIVQMAERRLPTLVMATIDNAITCKERTRNITHVSKSTWTELKALRKLSLFNWKVNRLI